MLGLCGCSKKIDKYFGDYEKPEILLKLKQFQKTEKANWEELGFWIDYNAHYSTTPLDVIPFASTGDNGIHFGFLTDFNRIKDLNQAPIVSIATSNDPPVNLVAENIYEFLSMVLSVQYAPLLADIYQDDSTLRDSKAAWFEEDKYKQRRDKPNKILKDEFAIKEITKPIRRLLELKENRKSAINTNTMDGLGIKFTTQESIEEFGYSKSPSEVAHFLSKANLNSRITFYRNATFIYILDKDYDSEIKDLVVDHLKKDGFEREAVILKEDY